MTKRFKMTTGKKVLLAFVLSVAVVGIVYATSDETEEPTPVASVKSDTSNRSTFDFDAPKVETKNFEESDMVPFETVTEEDATLPVGQAITAVYGVSGEKIITYKVTYHDGDAVKKEKVSERVSKEPVNEVKKIGTQTTPPAPAP